MCRFFFLPNLSCLGKIIRYNRKKILKLDKWKRYTVLHTTLVWKCWKIHYWISWSIISDKGFKRKWFFFSILLLKALKKQKKIKRWIKSVVFVALTLFLWRWCFILTKFYYQQNRLELSKPNSCSPCHKFLAYVHLKLLNKKFVQIKIVSDVWSK